MSDPGDELWDHDDYPSGFGEDYDEDPDCDHDDYEADILTGRATCNRCGHQWFQDEEEIAAEIERQRAYDEWTRTGEGRWVLFKAWVRGLGYRLWPWRLRDFFWRRQPAAPTEIDDEIPF
jgi:hypothetical protein